MKDTSKFKFYLKSFILVENNENQKHLISLISKKLISEPKVGNETKGEHDCDISLFTIEMRYSDVHNKFYGIEGSKNQNFIYPHLILGLLPKETLGKYWHFTFFHMIFHISKFKSVNINNKILVCYYFSMEPIKLGKN